MNKLKRTTRGLAIGFFCTFLLIVLMTFLHWHRVQTYNSTEHTFNPSGSTSILEVDLHDRGKIGDSWEKPYALSDGTKLYGKIYEATVTNRTSYNMTDWKLKINIKQDCFINNAWCGTVEIHQNVAGDEKVQTLDLREVKKKDITLDYIYSGPDLLIPLYVGDYVIYHPREDTYEVPIASTIEYHGFVNIGVIFYTYKYPYMDLSDYLLYYHVEKTLLSGTEALVIRAALIVWLLWFLIFVFATIIVWKYEEKLEFTDKLVNESLSVFLQFVEAKDPYTQGHSDRVAHYCRLIAGRLNLPVKQQTLLYYQGLMHDIGKCYIPDEILKKPDSLSPEEYEKVKEHATIGYKMLENFTSLPGIGDGALYHHERYDGTGYPSQIKGKQIPLSGRVVSIADYYDAIHTDRHYRRGLSKEESIEKLKELSGSRFDPYILDIFLEILEEDNFPNL